MSEASVPGTGALLQSSLQAHPAPLLIKSYSRALPLGPKLPTAAAFPPLPEARQGRGLSSSCSVLAALAQPHPGAAPAPALWPLPLITYLFRSQIVPSRAPKCNFR